MRPILFTVGDTAILSHGAFVVLGTLVALWCGLRIAIRSGRMSHELIWIVAAGLGGAAFLSRFGLTIRYALEPGNATLAGLLEYGGRTLLGGLAGACLGVRLTNGLDRDER